MIYKMDVWHKLDTQGQIAQELFCLSDMHGVEALRPQDALVMNIKDQEQRALLVAACKKIAQESGHEKLSHDSMLWIVEDPFSLPASLPAGAPAGLADYIKLYKPIAFAQPVGTQPILMHFLRDTILDAVQAPSGDLSVINAEYRQQRIVNHTFYIALGELTRSASAILAQFKQNINTLYGSSLREIAQEFDTALARVREYAVQEKVQQNPELATYYKTVISKAEKAEPFVALLRDYNYKYWDLASAVSPALFSTLVNSFLIWGAELVDAIALHELTIAQDRQKVCIIMGGAHIAAISQLLPALGYTKVKTVGTDSLTAQEHKQRAKLVEELYNVEQLAPKPGSLSLTQRAWRAVFARKNILVPDLIVNTDKLQEFNALNLKFAQVNSVDDSCFDMLAQEPKS